MISYQNSPNSLSDAYMLRLPLKTKWFEMTKLGIKTEDYRDINKFWIQRLVSIRFSRRDYKNESDVINLIIENKEYYSQNRMNKFTCNLMTLGYPASNEKEKILKKEHKGIIIRTGNPDWGAEPNKLYFVIIHGATLD